MLYTPSPRVPFGPVITVYHVRRSSASSLYAWGRVRDRADAREERSSVLASPLEVLYASGGRLGPY